MYNPSTEYEHLVRDLHQALLESDGVENISVRHNVKLTGKSGASHQIDVYWEFRLAGVTYRTCIECKQYGSSVKKSHIAAFAGVLDDIGNATGIYATTVGYQQGAKLLAKEKGIRLILVNNLLKHINLACQFSAPSTTITEVKYDENQARNLLIKKGLTKFSFHLPWTSNSEFYDNKGNRITTLKELFKDPSIIDGDGVIEPIELYDQTELGLLQIQQIKYRKTTHHLDFNQEIVVNELSRAIMEDVLDNHSCYLNDDGSVSKIENQ